LFWLYLWQLKEYHWGRFLAHFRTEKGKRIFANPVFLFKILLFLGAIKINSVFLISIALLFYFVEFLRFLQKTLKRLTLKPVFTKKIIFLATINFSFLIFYFLIFFEKSSYLFWFLFFDLFIPFFVSGIVLFFQPLTVFLRKRCLKKAKKKRETLEDLLVIGITGSYGKSLTKEILAEILSERYSVLKTKRNENSEIAIARLVLEDLKPEHQVLVAEIGAYNRGKIKEVCSFLKPKIGILTGINEQHMATFGSQEDIIKGKYELIESLPPDGMAFFNAKNEYCRQLYEKTKIKKFLYGQKAGSFEEENLFGAMAVARELGFSQEELSRASEKVRKKILFFKIKKGRGGINFLDFTYSANPNSVLSHLKYLEEKFSGKKIIIMPSLIELGRSAREVHRRIGREIAQVCDLAIITSKDYFKEIKSEAGEKAIFLQDPEKIFEKIKNFSSSQDIILLEGRIPKKIKELLLKA